MNFALDHRKMSTQKYKEGFVTLGNIVISQSELVLLYVNNEYVTSAEEHRDVFLLSTVYSHCSDHLNNE